MKLRSYNLFEIFFISSQSINTCCTFVIIYSSPSLIVTMWFIVIEILQWTIYFNTFYHIDSINLRPSKLCQNYLSVISLYFILFSKKELLSH